MIDYDRLWTIDHGSTMVSSDGCQWVRMTMTVLLLSFTAVKTMEVVLQETLTLSSLVCHVTARLGFVHDSDYLLHPLG